MFLLELKQSMYQLQAKSLFSLCSFDLYATKLFHTIKGSIKKL